MTHPLGRRTLARLLSSAAVSLALVMGGTTVVHASDLVDVPDANLAACIRAKLTAAGLSQDLTAENLARLTRMGCTVVSDLTGVEHLTGVTDLWIQFDDSVDLSHLAEMPALRTLVTGSTGLTSLRSLPTLPSLTTLRLQATKLNDISPLAGFTGLTTLSLYNNQISDLRPLADMTALTSLSLGHNQIHTLAGLERLSKLTTLEFSDNQVTDLSALAGLDELTELRFDSNQVTDLAPLSVNKLRVLRLWNNRVEDLSPLGAASSLSSLIMGANRVRDLSPLTGASSLRELNADSNQIENLGPEGSLAQLTKLSLDNNQITSVAALAGALLTYAVLTNNRISDVAPLSGVSADASVHLTNNRVRDFSPLPDHVSLSAQSQRLEQPGVATVGVPIDTGVRGLDGRSLCLAWPPEGASCSNGLVTYTIPGHPLVTVTDSVGTISTSWVQEVGPTGHLTPTAKPSIFGQLVVSATLETSEATWSPKPDSVTYQWYADGQPLDSRSRYQFLHAADLGKRITSCATAHRDSYYDDQVCSTPTPPIAAWQPGPIGVIVNAPRPTITGPAKVGRKLEVMTHSWDQGVSFHIRWQRNGKDIKGATHGTYRLTRADLHKRIRVKITGTKSGCKPAVRYSSTVRPKR